MKKIEWDASLNLGVKQIDDQHKRLIQLANNIIAAVHSGEAQDVMDSFFNELREYTVFHFRDEERFMEEVGYPERGRHHAMHNALKQRVKHFQRDLYEQKNISCEDVLQFMKGWLVDHILGQDMKIAKHIEDSKPLNPVTIGK